MLEPTLGTGALGRFLDKLGVRGSKLGRALGDLGLQALLVLAQGVLDLAAALDLVVATERSSP
jgi:hypothetical protein